MAISSPSDQPQPHQPAPKSTMLTTSAQPFAQAHHQLAEAVERYGPLDRGKRVNTFQDTDLVDQRAEGLPLSKLGVIVVATQKLKQWEAVVGEEYRERIGE